MEKNTVTIPGVKTDDLGKAQAQTIAKKANIPVGLVQEVLNDESEKLSKNLSELASCFNFGIKIRLTDSNGTSSHLIITDGAEKQYRHRIQK